MSCCYLRRARKALEGFFLSSCQAAQSPRLPENISRFFSCGPVVVPATTFSDSAMCLHGRWNLFYEPRLFLTSSLWIVHFGFLLLLSPQLVGGCLFDSLPDQFLTFFFQALHWVMALDNWRSAVSCSPPAQPISFPRIKLCRIVAAILPAVGWVCFFVHKFSFC